MVQGEFVAAIQVRHMHGIPASAVRGRQIHARLRRVCLHILHLMDMWLMEFRRILAPGGYALFTVHDEHTWEYLSANEAQRTFVDHTGMETFSGRFEHDIGFLRAGGSWDQVVSFLRTDWITREWGQYLDVVSFEPRSQSYQTTVVLRKS